LTFVSRFLCSKSENGWISYLIRQRGLRSQNFFDWDVRAVPVSRITNVLKNMGDRSEK